jgi:hypothetical protein
LLNAAETEKFEVMVTADQNLSYQQNLKDRTLALVVLGTNKLSLLEAEPTRIVRAVDGATVRSAETEAGSARAGIYPTENLRGSQRYRG